MVQQGTPRGPPLLAVGGSRESVPLAATHTSQPPSLRPSAGEGDRWGHARGSESTSTGPAVAEPSIASAATPALPRRAQGDDPRRRCTSWLGSCTTTAWTPT
ncbi:hypothetical protein AAFF_G00404710 [Aldrovandia affinis]|uniref:Uncharacterized protein n=1 Tax=Aldrovandia affinis TaxID=143900 RepID=A0AAD7T7L4_9TELE|nr:hypothetical protein AAFF_G00404710 [Aldrovandia affinis]